MWLRLLPPCCLTPKGPGQDPGCTTTSGPALLPTSSGVEKALAEIWNAEDRRHALDAVTGFKAAYGAKFPKAVAKITDDLDELLAFYDFPAEHWIHLRTTNHRVDLRDRPAPHEDAKSQSRARSSRAAGDRLGRHACTELRRGFGGRIRHCRLLPQRSRRWCYGWAADRAGPGAGAHHLLIRPSTIRWACRRRRGPSDLSAAVPLVREAEDRARCVCGQAADRAGQLLPVIDSREPDVYTRTGLRDRVAAYDGSVGRAEPYLGHVSEVRLLRRATSEPSVRVGLNSRAVGPCDRGRPGSKGRWRVVRWAWPVRWPQ